MSISCFVKRFLTFALLAFTALALAQDQGILNRLLAPGPLIEGHKELEVTRCLECHSGGKGVPNEKCLDCHKEIKVFVQEKRGFHGLNKETCIHCHADHRGRMYDSTNIDEKKFDHATTGYALKGKHAKITCTDCHKSKRTNMKVRPSGIHWIGSQTSCVSCHQKDDIHFFQNKWAKKDCNACHGLETWKKEIKFDHELETKYKLIGKHNETKCAKCHVPEPKSKASIYSWPKLKQNQCLSCHENFHKKNITPRFQNGKCNTCHDQTTWKIATFNHEKTGYKLAGKHAELKCIECHKQDDNNRTTSSKDFHFIGLKSACLSCHTDYHIFGNIKNRWVKNLNTCVECHNDRSWKQISKFNHDNQTRYVIDGAHEELKCSQCHVPQRHTTPPTTAKSGIYFWKDLNSKTCEACHKSPHTEVFSKVFLQKKCTECHITRGWKFDKSMKNFDHSKTRFELTGRHMTLKCNDCHIVGKKQVFKFKTFEKKFCIDCHQNVHEKQFHEKFSNQSCNECHSTKNFKDLLKFDHDKTDYPLRGGHMDLKCLDCHTPTNSAFNLKSKKPSVMHKFLFANLKTDLCLTCHTDFHKGQLSKNCKECHSETKWNQLAFDHNKQSQFKLKGKHSEIKCIECHKPRENEKMMFASKSYKLINYKPLDSDCVSCHKDHHKGKFGLRCYECHNESNWKNTRDFHKNFTLSGVHFTLQCAECHVDSRKLAGTSSACFLCHQKDDIHSGMLPNCGDCHRQQFWENAEFRHSMSMFPLRGIHRTLDCIQCHSQGMYKGIPSTCVYCHENDVPTSPDHSVFPNRNTCNDCHNQFTFDR